MPGDEYRGAGAEAGSYSRVEGYGVHLIQRVTTKLFEPAATLLVTLRISPNLISLLQPVLGLVMVLTVATQPRLTLALLLLALLLDGVDGTLARETGRASAFGALVDQFSDHTREVLLVAGLARNGALSSFWATLYALAYPGSKLALLLCNRHDVPIPHGDKNLHQLLSGRLSVFVGGGELPDPRSGGGCDLDAADRWRWVASAKRGHGELVA